ncbi:hypothetical protein [Luteirhabdus pelagi]|uniref:hypothetical protein n=1 Tax=Luteirhabdus pelagi TaxID=2792783 RepID=UPI0019399DA9|nr:hypothetical protein [Luteirhabdus pelagi]
MKAFLFSLGISLLLVSCSSVKRNQQLLSSGNYDQAIDLAVKKLQRDKNKDRFDEHIVLLEEAYEKAVEDDMRRIRFLKKSNEPNASRQLYFLYTGLENRQLLIRPLLPLYSDNLGRNAQFKFSDYSNEIIAAKQNYVKDLYEEGLAQKNLNTVQGFRKAYYLFCDVAELQPHYRNVDAELEDTRFLGTNFVLVRLQNRTGQIIPQRLERELLDFNTYGLDDFWTEYHGRPENGLDYHYGVDLVLQNILISPERISEKEFNRKRRVKESPRGDSNDEDSMDDEEGDNYIVVTAKVLQTIQEKAVEVSGNVVYRDLSTNQNINRYPLASGFIFENIFSKFRGDERALTEDDRRNIKNDFVPFPSNAQMVLDAGDDIKAKLKSILNNNSF